MKKEFRRRIAFEKQVAIDVTFQLYDNDWSVFVDLIDDEKFDYKEKLKVVVTSKLHSN